MKRSALAIVFAASMAAGTPGLAQPAPADHAATARTTLDAATKRAAVEKASKLLIEDYVFPDTGQQVAAAITRNLAAGKYDAITDPAAFAKRLTDDMRAIAHDLHLGVDVDDAPPSAGGAGEPPRSAFGFTRVDVLKGNIGYIELVGFLPKDLFKLEADKAMRQLGDTDALIIDVRPNGGGQPGAVAYLISFLVDPKTPVHVNDLLWRKPGTAEYRRDVFQTEPTPTSYLRKPVVVITGAQTISGGEELPYDLQAMKRATLVGETTAGGANPGRGEPLGGGLSIFLPSGRAENPITHANWEGRGVKPDVPTTSAAAFATAYAIAMGQTRTSAPGVRPAGPDAVLKAHLLKLRTTAMPGGEAAIRRVVAELSDGKAPTDVLGPSLANGPDGGRLSQLSAAIAGLGALQSVTFVEVGPIGDDAYDVKFAKGELRFGIVLDDDGKFVSLRFRPK
jgi:hypothetical protein